MLTRDLFAVAITFLLNHAVSLKLNAESDKKIKTTSKVFYLKTIRNLITDRTKKVVN